MMTLKLTLKTSLH